jgi:uncharacterized protein
VIIAFNSLTGFAEETIYRSSELDYAYLMKFTALAIAGIFIGFAISMRLKPEELKRTFGWFILLTGFAILVHLWGSSGYQFLRG